jgi:hypothetical protein
LAKTSDLVGLHADFPRYPPRIGAAPLLRHGVVSRGPNMIRSATAAMIGLLICNVQADASTLLDYRFTVRQPLQLFSETIGGPNTPIIFDFIVDPNTTNQSTDPFSGSYPIGDVFSGYASVTVGSTTSVLNYGGISVSVNQNGEVFNALASGNDTGARINGRSLFVSSVTLFDPMGQTFTGIGLPANVQSELFAVHFELIFRPGQLDLNQNDYLKFDAFVRPGDYSGTVTKIAAVPEVSTWVMMILGFAGTSIPAYRKRKREMFKV